VSFRPPNPGEDPARAARELLAPALAELQQNRAPTPFANRVLDRIAAAMSALYGAEAEAATEASVSSNLRHALDELTRALDALHERTPGLHVLDGPATAVARAMALLYPRVRLSERQRRGVVMAESVPSHERRALVAMADRIDAAQRTTEGTTPPEQRMAGQRVRVDVDVGVLSESNFYTGVAADVSLGGVFVSTPTPLPVGTDVALYFTLGEGSTLHTEAVVRWIRAKTSDLPAGMGVAFTRLSDDDRRVIGDFCSHRPPLFHD
jgi:uncharacterized protein (TIGR02266 family)